MAIKKLCPKCGRVRIDKTDKYCDKCQSIVDKNDRDRYKDYNRNRIENDREYVKFYSSKAWIRLREYIRAKYFNLCPYCLYEWIVNGILDDRIEDKCIANVIHHIETVKDKPHLKLDSDNLIPLCNKHHMRVHNEYDKSEVEKIKCQKHLYNILEWFKDYFGIH